MAAGEAGQALGHGVDMEDVGVGQQAFLRPLDVELQAVAMAGVDLVVGLQQRVTDPRHQEAAQPGVVAQLVLLAHPVQRNHPLPAIGLLAVPFAAKGQQLALGVDQVSNW